MKLSEQVKPISYLKANASEVIKKLNAGGSPMFVTVNGEAKAVLQDIREYEELQNAVTMLKVLNERRKEIDEGKYDTLENAMERIRKSLDK